jgi:hypothetical protein
MATTDIIARLQLRAEQFSSETGARFAELKTRARTAAQDIRQEFVGTFAEVQRVAATALRMPRTETGSLDLSAEVRELSLAADAAEQKALALREMSMAATAAAGASDGARQAMLLEADAAAVGALAEERNAQAIRERILALEAMQRELNASASETRESAEVAARAAAMEADLAARTRDFIGVLEPATVLEARNNALLAEAAALFEAGAISATRYTDAVRTLTGAKEADAAASRSRSSAQSSAEVFEAQFAREAEAADRLRASIDPAFAAQQRFNSEMGKARDLVSAGAITLDEYCAKLRIERGVLESTNAYVRAHGQGVAMVGQQFIDFAVQVNSGQSAIMAFTQQMPQATFALSTMGGKAGAIGKFMVGPWGTALTIGALVLTPLIANALDFGDAAEEAGKSAKHAAEGADAWSDAASSLGKIIDLTTGKLKSHNIVIAESIRLEAIFKKQQGEKEAEEAEKSIRSKANSVYSTPGGGSIYTGPGSMGGGPVSLSNPKFKEVADKFLAGGYNTSDDKSGLRGARVELEKLAGASGKLDGKNVYDFVQSLIDLGKARDKIAASDAEVDAIDGNPLDSRFKPYKRDPKPKKGRDLSGMSNSAAEEIARINAEWDEQPRLIDKAFLETQKLDHLISDLEKKRPPNWEKLVADAQAAKETIERGLITAIGKAFEAPESLYQKGSKALAELDRIIADLGERKPPNWEALAQQARDAGSAIRTGMDRPFTEFVRQQHESLAVGQLVLAGRDAEAEAVRNALGLQVQLGRALRDDELKTVLELAEQHERIARAIEDQRRVIGIYTGAVGEFQSSFEAFEESVQRGKIAGGIESLFGSALDISRKLQRSLVSNAIFGGVDRQVEDYIRRMTGEQTPAEILRDQAKDAGGALRLGAGEAKSALDEFVAAVRSASRQISGTDVSANDNAPASLAGLRSAGYEAGSWLPTRPADEYGDIVVSGSLQKSADAWQAAVVHTAGVWEVMIDGVSGNLQRNLGIKVPQTIVDLLKKDLPTVIQGASMGQFGGSVFTSIMGGRDDKLASSLGGIVGDIAGKELKKPIEGLISGGLGKTLGAAAGPLGAVLGGIAGNIISSIFAKPNWSNASLTLANGQITGTAAGGRGSAEIASATNTASSVADAVNQILDQIGADVQSLAPITLGTWNGRYRVADVATSAQLHSNNFGNNVLHDFGDDQQAAVQYAVAYEISHSVITGISEASRRILASGQNMDTALSKVLMVESIPKELKAMLDPVGAATDELNRKWQRTVDALKEGGASAEQMAEAQRLYDLQLAETLRTTASASQTLRDFRDGLMLGTNSPYSLRDQEATAMQALQPFFTQINAGMAVDQDKYRAAADAYLAVEREMYGSTQSYFTALDAVQAATNKAISTIDNIAPISPDVASPFVKATADSAAATATNTAASNDLLAQLSDQMASMNDLLARLGAATDASGFIGEGRLFLAAS